MSAPMIIKEFRHTMHINEKVISRNHSIDLLKFILAFEVVMLHCNQEPAFIFTPIVNSAVPCFFMISGYFIFSVDRDVRLVRLKKGIRRIAVILLWSTLICSLNDWYRLAFHHEWGITFYDVFIKFLLFNENPFAFHLWYIAAYLYVLIIFYLMDKHSMKISGYFILSLWIIGVLIKGYLQYRQADNSYCFYYRNFLFQGVPFFYFGMLVKQKISVLQRIKVPYIILYILLFELLEIFIGPVKYVSSSLIASLSFLLFLKIQMRKLNSFSKIGEEDGLYIYIFHPLVMNAFKVLFGMNLIPYNPYLFATVVFIATIILIRLSRLSFVRLFNS